MNVDLGIWSRLSRIVVFLLLVAGFIGVAIWYKPLIEHNERLRKRIYELEAQVQREDMENRKLEETIKALQRDPQTVERVVREKLNWAKPGETVIRFEEPQARPVPVQPAGSSTGAALPINRAR